MAKAKKAALELVEGQEGTVATAKEKTVYEDVNMDDGAVVRFPGKRRLLKGSSVEADGSIVTRFDFRNGEVRTFKLVGDEDLFKRFAAHGVEQKIGDEVAGLDDIDDMILAVDEVMERLQSGEWAAKRETSGLAGTSVLARALIQSTGKTPEVIKAFLAGKSNAEKLALRTNPKIAPIVAELEAKKKSKAKDAIDTDALLDQIG
jgi:hypothetical protein